MAFNAMNFCSYATQRLSILVYIGTTDIIKQARLLLALDLPRPYLKAFLFLVVS
jgi:hypothetical protein